MTQEESVRPFAMLHANWPFLDFSDETTAGIWYEALSPYQEPEVRQGIRDAIANLQKTPTVAEVLEFVRAIHDGSRRAAAEADRNRPEAETVACFDCNDRGYITIIFPNGSEAVRPCNCQAADRAFGKNILSKSEPLPEWKKETLFGRNEIPSQYELVRVSRHLVPTGEKYRTEDGTLEDRMVWGWVPYFPSGRPKEEVFMQYQKRRRR